MISPVKDTTQRKKVGNLRYSRSRPIAFIAGQSFLISYGTKRTYTLLRLYNVEVKQTLPFANRPENETWSLEVKKLVAK